MNGKAELFGGWANSYFENIVNTVRESLLVLDTEMKVVSANPYFAFVMK